MRYYQVFFSTPEAPFEVMTVEVAHTENEQNAIATAKQNLGKIKIEMVSFLYAGVNDIN